MNDTTLREILAYDRVAVVGCSSTPGKDAHEVPLYLQNNGYSITPVNPFADIVLDEHSYDSVAEIPPGTIDVVNVFRPSEEVESIISETLDRTDVSAIWTQLGIRDDTAASKAREAGLTVVQDRCMKVEHSRLLGDET